MKREHYEQQLCERRKGGPPLGGDGNKERVELQLASEEFVRRLLALQMKTPRTKFGEAA